MIVKLAEDACILLDEINSLEIAKKEAGDVEATLNTLKDVKEKATQVRNLCLLLGDRLGLTYIQQVELPRVLADVQSSHAQFSQRQERRQVQSMRNISEKLQGLITKFSKAWKQYASERIRRYSDLLVMVSMLPEMREQEAILYGLRSRLQRHEAIIPQTHEELADFDTALKQLRTKLAEIENLPPVIKSFLQKAYDNEATIADLTDEVLRWCRQGEHAKAFRISFLR